MLKAICVVSANDACVAMAEYLEGSTSAFVEKMNAKAKELYMNDTCFKNCHGIDEDGHVSSSYDIALMSKELLTKHPYITKYTTIYMDSLRNGKSELVNTNKLIRNYNGATGLKTGSTSLALYNLSASATRDNLSLIAVIMKAPTTSIRFEEAQKLLDYGFSNFSYEQFAKQGDILKTVNIGKGIDSTLNLIYEKDASVLIAKRENKNPWEIADFYMKAFLEDLQKLNIDKPEIIARATDHIDIMEEYVKKIIENGYTYQTDDTIYFDTSKLPNYGILSGKKVEDQKAGARVDFDQNKKNISDFALWIKAPKEHIMQWDSFFGKCYPGWHLECSAMGYKYLGERFDIHTGGIDHIPIHHENEIAQSEGFSGKIPAKFWMHVNFLKVNDGKMSKSLNNLYTIDELEERGFDPEVYRLFNFSSSYRNPINFTWEAMESTKKALIKLREGYQKHLEGNEMIEENVLNDLEKRFHEAINDDLNMPSALSIVWEAVRYDKKS